MSDDAADAPVDENPTAEEPLSIDEIRRDALATLAQIAKARAVVTRLLASSVAQDAGVTAARHDADFEELDAVMGVVDAIVYANPPPDPEKVRRARAMDPEDLTAGMRVAAELVDNKRLLAKLAEEPEHAELHATIMKLGDVLERARWAGQISEQLDILRRDLESIRSLAEGRLLGALLQSKRAPGPPRAS